ncbi:MAG: sulfite exporter TauE/SafE family protein [Sedimentisphaerales bacterium]|nr:sulfite exporter TauE/SafE family protein [Sedimentisphaerales bacterium]
MNIILYILLGLLTGVFSGMFGLGGGVVIIPALVFLFGLSQHQAQGTTLALLVPPIGLLAAWQYYKQGYVDLKIAAFVCLGFFFGGLLGAKLVVGLPEPLLRRLFGVALLMISIKMILTK